MQLLAARKRTKEDLVLLENSSSNADNKALTETPQSAKSESTRLEGATIEYDRIAMTHVLLALLPLAVGTTLYSLTYHRHRSWYSWAVSSLADTVYYLGFAALTPQLYINYKLRTVAHLPPRALAYKTFSTVVDDIYAYVVDMPLKHRLMTFRDDLIFIGFLYQW
jgi:hypothetical protein